MTQQTGPTGSTHPTGAPAASDRNSLTRRRRRPDPAARRALPRADGALQPRARARSATCTPRARGAFGVFETTEDVSRVHQGRAVPAGRDDRDAGPLLHRRRRAGQPRHLARPARLRAEVLHDRGQLRPRRQQHPGLLHPRHDEVPALHPQPEAPAAARACATTTCSGTSGRLNPESAHQVTYLMGDRGIPTTLPPHERLRLAHLHVDQRGRREVLGEVPLPQRPGRRGPHRRGGRPRIAGEDADFHRRDLLRGDRRAATSRAGRCRCR